MKAILNLILLAAAVSPSTCNVAEREPPARSRPSDSSVATTSAIPLPAPLDALRAACTNGRGSFDGIDCHCNTGSFSAETRACVDQAFYNADCAEKTGAARNVCVRVGLFSHGGTSVAIMLPTDAATSTELATWLRDVGPNLHPRIPPTPPDGSGATIVVTVGNTPQFSGDQIKNAFDNQLYHHQTGAIVPRKGYVHLHATSLNELAATLGDPHFAPQPYDTGLLPVWSQDLLIRELAIATKSAMNHDRVRAVKPRAVSSIGGSCLDSCIIERPIFTSNSTREAVVVDRYVGGIRQTRELRLLNPKNRIVEAKAVFDFGDRPSLAYVPTVLREGGKLITRVRILDRFLAERGTTDFDLLGDDSVLNEFEQASTSLLQDEVPIISFESGYSFQSPKTFEWTLRGPHLGSVVGWYPVETEGALEYARGFIPSYEESPFADRVSGDHPYVVNRILTGKGSFLRNWIFQRTRIVPLGSAIFSPMTATAVRKAMGKEYGGRVGTLSVLFSMDQAACRTSMREMLGTGLLLAVAAGNDNSDVAQTELCPQRLAPSPNLIVVAAAENGRMNAYSNYGKTSVDIAADGSTDEGADGGTSFAAPRVAYAAAQLAADPQIHVMSGTPTNAQIRMALLLSADLPPTGELHVRCGGSLTSDYTLARSALIHFLNIDPDKTVDMKTQVPFSVAYAIAQKMPGDAEKRLRILIRNEAVCIDDDACDALDTQCKTLAALAQMYSSVCNF